MRFVRLGRLPGFFVLAIWFLLPLTGCGTGVENVSLANEVMTVGNDAFTAERNAPTVSPNVFLNDSTTQHSVVGLRVTSYTQGTRGAVLSNGDGTFTYTPDPNKDAGIDNFTYTVMDEKGNTKTGRVSVTLLPGWTAPQPFYPVPDTLESVKKYYFDNGRILFIWQQKAAPIGATPSGVDFRVLWMQEYVPGIGWSNAKPLLNSITRWWSDQSLTNGDVVLVTNITSVNATDATKSTSALYTLRYTAAAGWEKNKVKISGDSIETALDTPCLVSAQATNGGAVVACAQRDTNTQKYTIYATYCAFTVAGQPCTWANYQSIDVAKTNGEGNSVLGQFITDGAGRVTLVWLVAESASGKSYLYTQTHTATTPWISTNARMDKPAEASDGEATMLQHTVDVAGNIHFTWVRPTASTNQLWTSHISWGPNEQRIVSTPVRLDNGTLALNTIALMIDEQGSAIVSWMQKEASGAAGTGTPVNYVFTTRWYKDLNGAWNQSPAANSESKTDADGDSSRLTVQASTLVWVKSYTDGTQKLWGARIRQGRPGPQVLLSTTPGQSGLLEPSASQPITIGDTGDLLWTYRQKSITNGLFGRDLHALRIPSDWAGWLPAPQPVTGQPTPPPTPLPAAQALASMQTNFDPSVERLIQVDAQNSVFVTWNQNDGYYNHLYASRFNFATKTWDAIPTQLDNAATLGSYTVPLNAWRLVSNAQGSYIAWIARNQGKSTLATRSFKNGKWLDDTQVLEIAEQPVSFDSMIAKPNGLPILFFNHLSPSNNGGELTVSTTYMSSYH